MYKSLEELMAGIYEMAAPHGIICNEVSKFLAANQVKPEDISSGIWFFLWLKSAPQGCKANPKRNPRIRCRSKHADLWRNPQRSNH